MDLLEKVFLLRAYKSKNNYNSQNSLGFSYFYTKFFCKKKFLFLLDFRSLS